MINNSIFIRDIFSKGNTNIFISHEISIESQIRVIISDIKSDKNTHIELDAFYDTFDLYQDLQQRKVVLQNHIAQRQKPDHWLDKIPFFRKPKSNTEVLLNESFEYSENVKEIGRIIEEEKQIRVNILELVLLLESMQECEKITQIKNAFIEGKIKLMDSILPEDYLLEHFNRYSQNEHNIQQVSERLIDNANEYIIKAQITILRFEMSDRFEKSIFFFETGQKSAKASKNNVFLGNYQFNYAHFLWEHKQINDALPLYEEALKIKRQLAEVHHRNDSPDLAMTLNNLAILYKARNEFLKSQFMYEESLNIFRQLSKDNLLYLPSLADTLSNLSNLYKKKNEPAQAQVFSEEALKIYRQLDNIIPKFFLPNVAGMLNNLANLYFRINNFTQAQSLYEEALNINRKLTETNPKTYLSDLAWTLCNLAILYSEARNEFTKAKPLYEESLKIRRQLAEVNPQTYLPDVAEVLGGLAHLHDQKNELSLALPLYEEALKIRRQLAETNPQTYLPDVAEMLCRLARLHGQKNELSLALPLYEEALKIRRQLAETNPQTYLPIVTNTLNDLASIYSRRNEFTFAQPLFEEGLIIYRQLKNAYPKGDLIGVINILLGLANLHLLKGESSLPQPLYEEVSIIYNQLTEADQNKCLPQLAESLSNLAVLFIGRKEFTLAEPLQEKALKIYLQLAEGNQQTYLLDVAMTTMNMSRFYLEAIPNKEKSLAYAKESLRASLPFLESSPIAQNYISTVFKILEGWGITDKSEIKAFIFE